MAEKVDAFRDDILKHIHALLLTAGTTFASLIFKTLPAFIPFIMIDYGFSYSFTAISLGFGSLITATSFITTPLVLHLRTNVVFSGFMLLECLGCFLLWYFRDSKIWFIIAILIIYMIENLSYACTNTVVATFVQDSNKSHLYLSANNAAWTIATFMFFGVGYLMQIGNIWLFLEVMFICFLVLAILDLIFLPKVSTNKYNISKSNANLKIGEEKAKVSIRSDLKVLSKIKIYWLTIVAQIFMFTAWGYFYVSFGLWLKGLFHINQATFGTVAGFAEGFGNLFAILTVTFLAKDDENKDENQKWKLSLQAMMVITSIIIVLAIFVIWLVIYVEFYNAIFIYITIGIFFYGLEACVCCALILMVNVVPALQQARASSMIGIMQAFTLFGSQSTVAIVYQSIGMEWESLILLILYVMNVLVVIYIYKTMKQSKLKEELIWINKDKTDIQRYT